MNPTELQRRLDALAVPPQDASVAEQARNRELVAARRRRRRAGGAVVAGVAAAVAVVVAVTGDLPGSSLTAQPAGPPQARAADPASLRAVAEGCARDSGRPGGVTALAGGTSDLADAVLYRFDDDGTTHFCTAFDGGSVQGEVPDVVPGPGAYQGGVQAGEDAPLLATLLGRRPAAYARVVVTTPDGQEYRAVFFDRYWWTPVSLPEESLLRDTTWAAYDHQGRLLHQERVDPRG